MAYKIGNTVFFGKRIEIISSASVVGKKEGDGPFGKWFDEINEDAYLGKNTYEEAESFLQTKAIKRALEKAKLNATDIDVISCGDLLNQCIGSSFGIKEFNIPVMGVYGACSTMGLSLISSAVFIESGAGKNAVSVTSSHFCAAERQYRFPLPYGSIRPLTAQWTVTGAGAALLSENDGNNPYIKAATVGTITDMGIKDQNNMGAAMAPAAAETIYRFFRDTETSPCDYDKLYTGDLGFTGSELLMELLDEKGIDISEIHADCGKMIYDKERQDVHSGGSGCGCSASIFCSYIMEMMKKDKLKNILFCPTGALLSPTSVLQKREIPGVAHLINVVK